MAKRRQNLQNIAWLLDQYKRGHLEMNPPYQRRSVWNNDYREQYIDTILLDYPTPAIFLFSRIDPSGTTRYELVDGKQRLMTVFDFIENKLAVGENSPLENVRGKYFKDLPEDNKIAFFEYDFSIEYLPTNNELVINDIFNRLNRNVAKLTAQELRHAKFDGRFIRAAEELSGWLETKFDRQFPRITPASKRQMKDVEIVATLLLFLEEGPKGYSALDLDEAFSERDKEWHDENSVRDEFRGIIDKIAEVMKCPEGQAISISRLRNQADFYSLFAAFAELMRENALEKDPAELAKRLIAFLEIVDDDVLRETKKDAIAYYDAARSASNDPGPRQKRIGVIKKVLKGDQLTNGSS